MHCNSIIPVDVHVENYYVPRKCKHPTVMIAYNRMYEVSLVEIKEIKQ